MLGLYKKTASGAAIFNEVYTPIVQDPTELTLLGGTGTVILNSTGLSVNVGIFPLLAALDLGSAVFPWRDGYFSGQVTSPTLEVDTITSSSATVTMSKPLDLGTNILYVPMISSVSGNWIFEFGRGGVGVVDFHLFSNLFSIRPSNSGVTTTITNVDGTKGLNINGSTGNVIQTGDLSVTGTFNVDTINDRLGAGLSVTADTTVNGDLTVTGTLTFTNPALRVAMASQTIASATVETLTNYGTPSINQGFTSFTSGVLTIATTGNYLMSATVGFDTGSTSGDRTVAIYKNTSTLLAENVTAAAGSSTSGGVSYLTVSFCDNLAATDTIIIKVYQTSGTNRTIETTSILSVYLIV